MSIKADVVCSTRIYPQQQKAWQHAIAEINPAEALREAMRLYCEVKGVMFPMFDTGGKGQPRRGKRKFVPKRKPDERKVEIDRQWTDILGRTYYQARCPHCGQIRRLQKRPDGYYLLHCGVGQRIEISPDQGERIEDERPEQ